MFYFISVIHVNKNFIILEAILFLSKFNILKFPLVIPFVFISLPCFANFILQSHPSNHRGLVSLQILRFTPPFTTSSPLTSCIFMRTVTSLHLPQRPLSLISLLSPIWLLSPCCIQSRGRVFFPLVMSYRGKLRSPANCFDGTAASLRSDG